MAMNRNRSTGRIPSSEQDFAVDKRYGDGRRLIFCHQLALSLFQVPPHVSCRNVQDLAGLPSSFSARRPSQHLCFDVGETTGPDACWFRERTKSAVGKYAHKVERASGIRIEIRVLARDTDSASRVVIVDRDTETFVKSKVAGA